MALKTGEVEVRIGTSAATRTFLKHSTTHRQLVMAIENTASILMVNVLERRYEKVQAILNTLLPVNSGEWYLAR